MPVFFKNLFAGIMLCCSTLSFGQMAVKDSVKQLPEHHPGRATLYSALLPGLGQAYNKKYWKIPLLYAGFAAMGYFIKTNNDRYMVFQKAIPAFANDPNLRTYTIENREFTLDNILIIKDGYRRNRDLSIIFTSIIYILNILDANVDAHLFYFNVNDNLSLRLQPAYIPMAPNGSGIAGLNLCMSFK
jgi:hypothetical protein